MVDPSRIDSSALLKQSTGKQEPLASSPTIDQAGRVGERTSMRNRQPTFKQREIAGHGMLDTNARVLKPAIKNKKAAGNARISNRKSAQSGVKREQTPQKRRLAAKILDEESEDELALLESSPIKDNGENDTDSDFDIEAAEIEKPVPSTSKAGLKNKSNSIPYFASPGEETIEQWYTDPYERTNPSNQGYLEWRRRNLQNSMVQQGWTLKHANEVVSWLLRCDGRWKPWDHGRNENRLRSSRRKRKVRFDNSSHGEDLKVDEDVIDSIEPEDDQQAQLQGGDADDDDSTYQSAISSISKTISAEKLGSRKETGILKSGKGAKKISAKARSNSPLLDLHLEDSLLRGRTYNELDDDEKITMLKRSLTVFEMVYGKTMPEPDYVNIKIDHMSPITILPKPRPKFGYRTQGHNRLVLTSLPEDSEALHNHVQGGIGQPNNPLDMTNQPHSRQVWTEDPTFGIHHGTGPEWYTREELAEQKAQRMAENVAREKLLKKQALIEERARNRAYFAEHG